MARDYATLIGHLIANAEDERQSPEARATYRQKAEHLMREYRISEEETVAKDQFSLLPIERKIVLMEGDGFGNPLRYDYMALWSEIEKHSGIRSRCEYRYLNEGNDAAIVAVAIGYESDLALAEFYWTAARLTFLTRIDARVNPDLSDQENCYFLRNSGMPRNQIANQLWGSEMTDGAAHGKVQKLYRAECAKRGEEPRVAGRGIQVKLYRKAYANAFVSEFGHRLREARDAADSVGGALVLPGRKERVNEAFYERFPKARPESPEEQEIRIAKAEAEEANCKGCKKTTSKSGKCASHRPTAPTVADFRRWARESNSSEARAGRRNGAEAARSVNVQRTAGARNAKTNRAPARPEIG